MQIRVEIDLKPEELRTFLGLPDVAGIQEDLINYARDKLATGMDDFDPATFVRENLDTIRGTKAWQKLIGMAFGQMDEGDDEAPTARPAASKRPRSKPKP